MGKVLGLDLGTNSIGWAIVDKNGQTTLIDEGVHIFQEGVKIEQKTEYSKAAERTDHRALRRHYFRRRLRKIETLKVLSDLGYCPSLSDEQLKTWQTDKVYPMTDDFFAWQRTDDQQDKNPYHCRYVVVHRKLNLQIQADRFLLGRAFYHIAQRRGFLSNRLESTKESEGKVKENIDELNTAITANNCRTLGEYFYRCYGKDKIRGQYTSRKEHFEVEFNEICRFQELPEAIKKSLYRAIFFQRHLRSQKELVGHCTFEPSKARCPISHPRYEYYRQLCFINNIRIKTPLDTDLRPLTATEKAAIQPQFFRTSKETFEFQDLAKKLSTKDNYASVKNPQGKGYLFNFRMDATVSGSPLTAHLTKLFGENWAEELQHRYTLSAGKSQAQVVNDIWHVLFSFADKEHLVDFAKQKLQLNDNQAKAFANIKIHQDYAALSLCAINKIIPFLEQGLIYPHAVFLANMNAILPKSTWNNSDIQATIIATVKNEIDQYDRSGITTLHQNILNFLRAHFELKPFAEKRLYHPSMIETYPESHSGFLESPRTNAVRNPMAMRTLFQLRRLINQLLREEKITKDTKINIELSRELNNANMRKAIEQRQRELEIKNQQYRTAIKENPLFANYEPSKDDILKYQLWSEQKEICLYTGKQIRMADFIGANPAFDIEHTIPRSMSGDCSQMNKTLADKQYNRAIKGAKMPSKLADFNAIQTRLEPWREIIEELEKQIEANKKRKNFSSKEEKDIQIIKRNRLKIEWGYWKGKYDRFMATEAPTGFHNSQGSDAGIISKYARLYLQSLFPKVYAIKGIMTAEFRKLWGLQQDYEQKDRENHRHHCIDAITIACIGKWENDTMSTYYRAMEDYERGQGRKPIFKKPWATFTEDVKAMGDKLLVSHYTPDNMGKHTKKRARIQGKIIDGQYLQGDTARGSLHQDTYYGAIRSGNEIKYVVRKELGLLKNNDVDQIVDSVVRGKVQQAVAKLGFKAAMASTIWMNEEKGIPIKKVRYYTPLVTRPLHIRMQRDLSVHDYKHQYHVVNGNNYMMAIYEKPDAKGKLKREFELINNLTAASNCKQSTDKISFPDLVPIQKNEMPLKFLLKTGTMVIFWEHTPDEIWELDKQEISKRLYKVTGMSTLIVQNKYSYGTVDLRHHQEARPAKDLQAKNGLFQAGEVYRPLIHISHTQLNVLVQGYDFDLTILGEVRPITH